MDTKAKTIKGLFQSYIRNAKEIGNIDVQFILEEMLSKVEQIIQTKIVQVDLEGWKGKDIVEYIEGVDNFEIITHQKKDQDSAPEEHKKIISKITINQIIESINNAKVSKDKKGNQFIKTRDIAFEHCILTNMKINPEGYHLFPDNQFNWQAYFGSRFLHTQLNLILRLLDYYKVIKYRAGRTIILNNKFKFQTKLK